MPALLSMTGYGHGSAPCLGGKVGVEVRTVNHKYCDVKTRLPRDFNPLEPRLGSAVKARLARGHIEVSVRWEELPPGRTEVRVDLPRARAILEAFEKLRDALGLAGEVDLALLDAHDVVAVQEVPGAPEDLWPGLSAALESALDACVAMREAEGRALLADLLARCDRLDALRADAAAIAPRILADLEARLRERLAELASGVAVDPARLAQEVAFWAERADVAEELKRLESHLAQLREIALAGGPVGRKLDFLCQELNREINTLGAKSQSVEMTRIALEFKSELEKAREQIQNVE
jgi:uncharacterized protein (TIGR00255 family)